MADRLTLSFDNGPTPRVTSDVLDVLAARGVRAAFFVVGRKLEPDGARDLVGRAKREGHWIGNHTLTHSVPLGERAAPDHAETEIGGAQAIIGSLATSPLLFRPFGRGGALGPHLLSRAAAQYLVEHRYTCVIWNCVPGDWRDPEGWVETCLAEMERLTWPLVVLHDVADACLARLSEFLHRVAARGVELRQDFPPDCLLLDRGRATIPLEPFVSTPHLPPPAAQREEGRGDASQL
jgi:peptidoglycan/xylan/chitin deacetylase (PgdA/CDA1 family)